MNKLQEPVLIVDDEADIRDLMEMTLMKMGLRVDTAAGVEEAKDKLDNNDYSLVLTDMRMPDGSGLEVVQYIDELMLDTPVAVITAFGNADQAVEALKAGAFDYLQKPITLSQLRSLVKSAVSVSDNTNEPTPSEKVKSQPAPVSAALYKPEPQPVKPVVTPPKSVQSEFNRPLTVPEGLNSLKERFSTGNINPALQEEPILKGDDDMPRLLGTSPQMVEVRHLIRRLARSLVPVYISGESGTGKEQAARTIHELSDRADKPFIAVNCGAIPENLMESEFFGYKKGSFTGADQDRLGFFQHAHGGTLFLDEVADLPLAMQVKLLRAIQEKAVRRIGDAQEVKVDVRIISATHKNLPALVESGAFRQDLFYRLNVVTLHMPALREMHEDLANLIAHLLRKHQSGDISMTPAAREALLRYNYPGNFRELENILERAVALASNHTIDVDDLQITTDPLGGGSAAVELEGTSQHQIVNGLPNFQMGTTQIQDYLDDIERQILEYALRLTQGNRTQAAKTLGISFRSMRYRLERLNIDLGA